MTETFGVTGIYFQVTPSGACRFSFRSQLSREYTLTAIVICRSPSLQNVDKFEQNRLSVDAVTV